MYIDIHILQTVPPSNLNRDDTGSPKTALFGGVRRARVSSQAWKRATREHFNKQFNESGLGYRTKRIVDLLNKELEKLGVEDEAVAVKVIETLGVKVKAPKVTKKGKDEIEPDSTSPQSDYLLFVSAGQISNLARIAARAAEEDRTVTKKELLAAFNADHSVDIALFGRMVADDADYNVDAAVQVAHAIGVDRVVPEFDYFTAVDDLQKEDNVAGAAMIGTVEFNSSTLYRYATVNVDQLRVNLGDDDATVRAVTTFVDSFVRSMPTGKQNTFANRTLPEAVVAVVREDQPVNLVGAFELPVHRHEERSIVDSAAKELAIFNAEIGSAYGPSTAGWVAGTPKATDHLASFGDVVALSGLVDQVGAAAARALGGRS